MSDCRFCHREIRWCKLVDDGAKIALDIAPSSGGSYAVAGADSARLIPRAERGTRALYHRHSETCPKAHEAAAYFREKHARPRARASVSRAMQQLGDGPLHVWLKPR